MVPKTNSKRLSECHRKCQLQSGEVQRAVKPTLNSDGHCKNALSVKSLFPCIHVFKPHKKGRKRSIIEQKQKNNPTKTSARTNSHRKQRIEKSIVRPLVRLALLFYFLLHNQQWPSNYNWILSCAGRFSLNGIVWITQTINLRLLF